MSLARQNWTLHPNLSDLNILIPPVSCSVSFWSTFSNLSEFTILMTRHPPIFSKFTNFMIVVIFRIFFGCWCQSWFMSSSSRAPVITAIFYFVNNSQFRQAQPPNQLLAVPNDKLSLCVFFLISELCLVCLNVCVNI